MSADPLSEAAVIAGGHTPGPVEVLRFLVGYSEMPAREWQERWPEWAARHRAARASDPRDPDGAAQHAFVLPLMRAAIALATTKVEGGR